MRVLLITDEEWNDYVYGNGVLTNWFTGFDAEFAQIYCSPGMPINAICDRYFQITDAEMVQSLLSRKRAGHIVKKDSSTEGIDASKENAQRKGVYKFMKQISLWMHTPIMMLRDLIWCTGRYDAASISDFVQQFNPDIVFCPRYVTPKLMRLEKLVSKYTGAPFVAFTGDNEASMEGVSLSPLYWIRKFYIHRMFKKHVRLYSHYLMHSQDQAHEYRKKYDIPVSTFFKCGSFPEQFHKCDVHSPIRLVYAGRLYCNRWKSLAKIGEALKQINAKEVRMVLDIYTTEKLSKIQRKALSEKNFVYVKGSVAPNELAEIYRQADIALHVESMDKKNRILTRVSFSTKIIDLMASTCAIMAVCWDKHTGYQYLKDKDSAFCISDYNDILPTLNYICNNPKIVEVYAQKAYECGKKYHSRAMIHNELRDVFLSVILNKH